MYTVISFVMQRLDAAVGVEPVEDGSLPLESLYDFVVGIVDFTECGVREFLGEHPALHPVEILVHCGKARLNVVRIHRWQLIKDLLQL